MVDTFRNFYECECGQEWSDDYSCEVDDRCPGCGTDTQPHQSESLMTESEWRVENSQVVVELVFFSDVLEEVKVHDRSAPVEHTFVDFDRLSEDEADALPDGAENLTGSRVFVCSIEGVI